MKNCYFGAEGPTTSVKHGRTHFIKSGVNRLLSAALPAAALLFAATASADIIGVVSLGNVGNGGVVVSATRIDFQPPANPAPGAPGYGVFQVSCLTATCTGADTNLTYIGGGGLTNLTPGELGEILDLDVASPPPTDQFITLLPGVPASSFDLTLTILGGGQSSNDCATFSVGVGCSPFITFDNLNFQSPFVLTYLGLVNGVPTTLVGLSLGGTGTDASTHMSTFSGGFTTQIAGMTPGQIETMINNGGSIQSSYSGQLTATFTAVPEPSSMAMMGFGGALILAAVGLRRKHSRS